MTPQPLWVKLLLGLLLLHWAISLRHLDVVPPVYEDEPWQASTGWNLATEGVFGSDMFAGFYNMESRYYSFMPIHPLLLAVAFRSFGLGLFQARFEAVAMGLLILSLTFALGRRLFGAPVGALAVVFLVFVRWTGLTQFQITGIPLIDLSRIARYDIVVPVFGLASLHAYRSARRGVSPVFYLLAGLLTGLAGLAHLYGVFWLPALLLLTLWDQHDSATSRWQAVWGYLLFGFLLAWLPYLVYAATDLVDFFGQNQAYGYEGRFDLLNPAWYWQNLLTEPKRYGPGLGPLGWSWLLRIGLWSTVIGLPLSLGALAARAVWQRDKAARMVIVPLVVMAGLFALFLQLKLVNYTLTLVPLAAIGAAWGIANLWQHLSARRKAIAGARGRVPLLAMAILLLAVLVEGAWQIAALEDAAAQATPYTAFIRRVREHIPDHSRVLALHNYWFGLSDYDLRAFWVPMRWTDAALVPNPVPFDVALDRISPDILLLDQQMRGFLQDAAQASAPEHDLAVGFWTWMERRGAMLVAHIEDRTYGVIDVYTVGQ